MASTCRVMAALYFFLTISHKVSGEPKEPCSVNVDWKLIPDKSDCGLYYTCSRGELTEKSCPPGKSFYKHMCFESFSKYDLCNRPVASKFTRARLLQPDGYRTTCEPGETGVFPHPTKCAQYFNCSDPSTVTGIVKRRFLKECAHPFLFDVTTQTCRPASVADCGIGRDRPATECDYIKNQCLSGHAMPCSTIMPTCEGLPDGPNSWTGRVGSPEYIICKQGSLLSKDACNYSFDASGNKRRQNFNPSEKRCELLPSGSFFG